MKADKVILAIAAITLLVILVRQRSYFTPGDVDDETRVCRCVPWHDKMARGETWGKPIVCPGATLLAGVKYWCTSDSERCMELACNNFV